MDLREMIEKKLNYEKEKKFNTLKEFEDFLKSEESYPELEKIVFNFECDKNTYEKIKSIYGKVSNKPINFSFRVKRLEIPDANNLIEIEEFLEQNKNGKIKILSDLDYDEHSLNEVLEAQKNANKVVDKLKESNLSPFEKYMSIYNFLTTKVYHESDNDLRKSREIFSILNGQDIVCVGYANLMQYLCEEVDIPCIVQSIRVERNEKVEGHANNIVCIEDDKYNIHGLFYSDACWDSTQIIKGNERSRSLNYCLLPLSDKDKIKGAKICMEDNYSQFFYNNNLTETEKLNNIIDAGVIGQDSMATLQNQNAMLKMIHKDNEYYNEIHSKAENIVLDNERVAYACDLLSKLFEENGIQDDIYSNIPSCPKSLRFESLLGLCMSKNPDIDLLKNNISILKSTRKKYKKSVITKLSDKFKSLTGKNKILNVQRSIKQDLEDYRKNDNEVLRNNLANSITNIKMSMDLTNGLIDKTKPQPISVTNFISAIKVSCKNDGMTDQEAFEETKGYIDRTELKILKTYNEGAQNDFYKSEMEILNRKQKENKKSVDLEGIQYH